MSGSSDEPFNPKPIKWSITEQQKGIKEKYPFPQPKIPVFPSPLRKPNG